MKESLKRIAAVFLSVAMAVTFMPILGMNPEKAYASNGGFVQGGIYYGINDDGTVVVSQVYNEDDMNENLTIPASISYTDLEGVEHQFKVIGIGYNAFGKCSKLKTVVIEDGIECIEAHAFSECPNLTAVSIPSSVTTMKFAAFYKSPKLERVILDANITSISHVAFYQCYALNYIEIPDGVTTIEENAFRDCRSLEHLEIPQSVESIGADAYNGCSSLTSVVIPPNVKKITIGAFWNVADDVIFHYLGSSSQLASISGGQLTNVIDFEYHCIPEPTPVEKATLEKDGIAKYCCSKDNYQYPKEYVISSPAAINLSASAFAYNGSEIKPAVTVVDKENNVIKASNYDVSYSNNVNVGTAAVNVTFKGEWYEGSMNAAFTINKAANTLTAAGKTFKVKAKQLKKKAKKFSISKVVTVTGARGAVTYAKASGNKKITVSKTGKVTVKKKLKKGTYKVKVNVTAAGNDAYDPATKTVTFKVKVK